MIYSTFSFFLAKLGADTILQRGLDTSQGVANAWNQHWLNIFQSELYYAIVYVAGLFAAGTLVFFMIQFIRRMVIEEDLASSLQSLIIPVVICILLANNAFLLSRCTIGLRGVVHGLSNQVLSITLMEVKLQDAIQASADRGAISSQISALLTQCQGMVGERQTNCFKAANEQAEAIVQDYQAKHPFDGAFLKIKAEEIFSSPDQLGYEMAGQLANLVGGASQALVTTVLWGFQWAFANTLEIAMLLTGLMGPLAVAGAFMFDGKPLWTWLTGFFSLGLAQVSYNIIVGIAAVVVVNADVTDTLGFLVIMAILAPALALALAGGGGMAIFHVMNTGTSHAMNTLASHVPFTRVSLPLFGR